MAQSTETATCEACENTGWEPVVGDDGIRRMRHCQAPGCEFWERKRGYAPGVPDDAKDVLLASYGAKLTRDQQNEDAIRQAKFFLDGVHPGLYIHGDVGSGKTLLACAILNDLHRTGQRVRFIRCQELLNQMMPGSDAVDGCSTRWWRSRRWCWTTWGPARGRTSPAAAAVHLRRPAGSQPSDDLDQQPGPGRTDRIPGGRQAAAVPDRGHVEDRAAGRAGLPTTG
jgi:hypothetical protein